MHSLTFLNHLHHIQVSGVTWWPFSPAGSPLTCISIALLVKFRTRLRAATTPAAHSAVQVSTARVIFTLHCALSNSKCDICMKKFMFKTL